MIFLFPVLFIYNLSSGYLALLWVVFRWISLFPSVWVVGLNMISDYCTWYICLAWNVRKWNSYSWRRWDMGDVPKWLSIYEWYMHTRVFHFGMYCIETSFSKQIHIWELPFWCMLWIPRRSTRISLVSDRIFTTNAGKRKQTRLELLISLLALNTEDSIIRWPDRCVIMKWN